MLSTARPMTKITSPAISQPVPKEGLSPPRAGSETAGEFRMTVGSAGGTIKRYRRADEDDIIYLQTTQTFARKEL